ncbi:R3H and G-patch domain-containing protein [Blastomyces dermatitidis ATCC 18188]|uniref:Protein SQS1 n=1 Tax=Ajellomyces dermatitidis (strain ATCC 18188 / CBS 674.68) TaxID=653446 RepID=F2TAI8_AJEDA|nr:R3H and G-patch domain-containing protein [Blastomyces dermatitidis ATCC 18188]
MTPMARSKKTKGRGGGGYRPGSPAFVVATRRSLPAHQCGFNRANNTVPYIGFKQNEVQFTMAQEARDTERYTAHRSNLKLRYNEIRFVSAGDLVQESLEVPNDGNANNAPNGTPANPDPSTLVDKKDVEEKKEEAEEEDEEGGEKVESMLGDQDIFFIDRKGEDPPENMQTENHTIELNLHLSSQPDSSEDEVIFTGRGRRLQQSPAHRNQNLSPNRKLGPSIRDDSSIPADCGGDSDGAHDKDSIIPRPASVSDSESEPAIIYTSEPVLDDLANPPEFISLKGKEKRPRTRKPRKPRLGWDSDDSEILADYIANMMDDSTSDEEEEEDEDAGVGRAQIQNRKQVGHSSTKSWSSADIEDLNDLSSSDELPEEIGRIFSMRERGESIQYLLTGKGQSTDEARWVRKERLIMSSASELIQRFEENVALIASQREAASKLSSSDLDEEDENEEDEIDQDLDDGMKQDLTDEQMARLLQTQDSLGLGTDDLLLFNGDGGFDGLESFSRSKFPYKSTQPKKRRNRNGNFPSASAFADALDQDPYGGFDVMDFDRPSLRKKPKGRRHAHQNDFDLSDSDMAYELQVSWENDRNKKKARKQEREELRAQGLLDTKPGKVNMKAKYTEGMSIDDVKLEIRAFLASSSQSLSLPPMDKRNRKLVHEIANILSLKSLSRGSGTSRFPILTKTSRTPSLEGQAAVHQVDRVFSSSRFMRRMDKSQRGGPKPVAKSRGGGVKGTSYMDGDVVGASAPEIGAENKGRAMLEKMGWSSGTALGAANNKGILHPVVHVVKNSKAGLG